MHFLLFKCLAQTHMIITISMFCRYDYAYGPNDHHNNPNHEHARLIKQRCLVAFSFKQLYTHNLMWWSYVHSQIHTQTNGELTYG